MNSMKKINGDNGDDNNDKSNSDNIMVQIMAVIIIAMKFFTTYLSVSNHLHR